MLPKTAVIHYPDQRKEKKLPGMYGIADAAGQLFYYDIITKKFI